MGITFFATSANSGEARVRVFSGSEFPSILEKDESGAPKGLAIDILNKISDELDTRFEVKFYPWKRALLAAKNVSVDGIIDPYQTAERRQFLVFTEKPFHIDRMVFSCPGRLERRVERRLGDVKRGVNSPN
jgi:ABC-type amino acid transport substrate-binding protein